MSLEIQKHQFVVPLHIPRASQRADRCIAETWGIIGRSQLKNRLVQIWLNGKAVKVSALVGAGDVIEIGLAPVPSMELTAQPMDLAIIFENQEVIVIDKAPGMVVHPAAGNLDGTLVNGLLHYVRGLEDAGFEDEARPGIVHRLDKETSGVLIVAKNPRAHEFLAKQFQERSTAKTYLALATGASKQREFTVQGCLRRDPVHRQKYAWHATEGKAALTNFRILQTIGTHHLIEAIPHTGRTHQIRVHLAHQSLPILADPTYGHAVKAWSAPRCMLHAWRLSIVLPNETAPRLFEAAVPQDFREAALAGGLTIEGIVSQAQ